MLVSWFTKSIAEMIILLQRVPLQNLKAPSLWFAQHKIAYLQSHNFTISIV